MKGEKKKRKGEWCEGGDVVREKAKTKKKSQKARLRHFLMCVAPFIFKQVLVVCREYMNTFTGLETMSLIRSSGEYPFLWRTSRKIRSTSGHDRKTFSTMALPFFFS